MRSSGTFVREATGLVRQLSALDVFVWSIIFFPWLTSWAGIFWVTPSYYQNVDYYTSLLVWAVIALAIVILYWQLTAVMPRAGGDYVFISRALSSPVGFVASFLFFVAVLISAGSGSYWAFAEVGTQLTFAGQTLGDGTLIALGNLVTPWSTSSPWLLFTVGLAIIALGGFATIAGGRVFRILIYTFFVYGFFVLALVLVIFLTHSHADFVQAYNIYFQGGVAKVFLDASAKGYSPGTNLVTLGAIVPLLFVSIGPYPVMQTVGGEIRNPRRNLLYGLVLAELVSILVWYTLTFVLDRIIGISFIEAWTLTIGAGSSTVPTAFVTVLEPSKVLLWLIVVGLFIGNIGWSWLSLVFLSRLIMAWSFDRILPAALAHVDDRFHTPTSAVILTCILAIIPMYLGFFTSFITAQVNAIFLYTVVWFLAAVSAIVLPFRRKAIYDNSPGKFKLGRLPAISVLGFIGVILFGYLGYNAAVNPAIGPFQSAAQFATVTIVIIPIILYGVSYVYNRRRGIDLRKLCAQLPPD
jgi:amino acid transporter